MQCTYVGPLEDQVYWLLGSFFIREYWAAIIAGDTMAPTPVQTEHQLSNFSYQTHSKYCLTSDIYQNINSVISLIKHIQNTA